MNDLTLYLKKVLEYEEKGFATEAVQLFDKILEAFPDDRDELLPEYAKLKYRSGLYKEALFDFIDAYQLTGEDSIYDLILEAYYQGNAKTYQSRYLDNCRALEDYPYCYSDMGCTEERRILPIWTEEGLLVWVDCENRAFSCHKQPDVLETGFENTILSVVNEVWEKNLEWIERHFGKDENLPVGAKQPLYFIFDREYWELALQLIDFRQFMDTGRVVFLVGEECVKDYFMQEMSCLPEEMINEKTGGKYSSMIRGIAEKRDCEQKEALEVLTNYYREHEKVILKEIKEKKARILFFACRFTTVLQYHAKACMSAAERLGYEVSLFMEKDNISRITFWDIYKKILEMKPHIVFDLDHFRFENTSFPKELVYITWIQDPMPLIMNKNTPEKLLARDIIISHFTTWRTFRNIGYHDVIDAPIPADPYVYRPYQLTEEEYHRYQCDICFVCHGSDVEPYIKKFLTNFPQVWQERILYLYKEYQNCAYQTETFYYSEEDFRDFIDRHLQERFAVKASADQINFIADDMYNRYNQRVYRQCLVDWLLDAGYTNIRLWGNGWMTDSKYEKYAMGPAENGETLSKIYQASKIVLGNNIMTTAAARAWESMLSGAFYMSNYIPPEEDVTDIRKVIKENEEVVMFYDRADLLQKVDYYLSHEEERQRMAEVGHKTAQEKMTFDRLMEKVLAEVPQIIEKREKKEM